MEDQDVKRIFEYIRSLEERIKKLEHNAAPTIPIYNKNNWPQDAVEGQVVISPI